MTLNVKEDLKPRRRKKRTERKQKIKKSNFGKPEKSQKKNEDKDSR
ncbi:4484_t:CDS:2 [Acaulospora morrowiae]|uniref:4484_t:CDS:1 n=1 Tax=Acaulospora morrowiae TaxID=94023 RepID=A0A9N8V7I3_9GLOM|nr:4484_t:CDS:2 [Acaulospora morrowiae]